MVCAGNGMFKKQIFEFCSRLTSSMLAGFLLPDQEGDEYKEDKKPFARFSFQRVPFSCEKKTTFQPCPSISALVSLGHAILSTTISQIQQK